MIFIIFNKYKLASNKEPNNFVIIYINYAISIEYMMKYERGKAKVPKNLLQKLTLKIKYTKLRLVYCYIPLRFLKRFFLDMTTF